MTSITQEVQKAIEQNLPSATAGVMKDFIKEAEATKTKLTITEEENTELKQTIHNLKAKLDHINNLEERENKLEERTQETNDKAYNLDLQISSIRLEEAGKRQEVVERLVDKVFGHPSVTITKNTHLPVDGGGNGCCGHTVPVTDASTETHGKR